MQTIKAKGVTAKGAGGDDDDDISIIGVVPSRMPNTVCPICHESLHALHAQGGQGYAVTGCGHAFHVSCLVNWALAASSGGNPSCPTCRRPLVPAR